MIHLVKKKMRIFFCDMSTDMFLFVLDNTFATQINRVVVHPTMPMVVSGHEDRHIKFYDLNTGIHIFIQK